MGETIDVCVPTGNFGNILGAFIAKKIGLPLENLICASNEVFLTFRSYIFKIKKDKI
jgi:threonine synthase